MTISLGGKGGKEPKPSKGRFPPVESVVAVIVRTMMIVTPEAL
jgi:hypothetical protein